MTCECKLCGAAKEHWTKEPPIRAMRHNEAKVYNFIVNFRKERAQSPTFEEIAEGTGYAKSWVHNCVTGLESIGKIHKTSESRSIIPLD